MSVKNSEIKTWSIYFVTILTSTFIHEVGHCIPAWIHGFQAIPTPAKEYIPDTIPIDIREYVSLGGILGSVIVSLIVIFLYIIKKFRYNSAVLAGVIAMPGMLTLRFVLFGRGHDATEFQEAQFALGLSYSGHALDWIFLCLFLLGMLVWIIKSKPHFKIIGRLFIGSIVTFVFVVGLQVINNSIFDPVFQTK